MIDSLSSIYDIRSNRYENLPIQKYNRDNDILGKILKTSFHLFSQSNDQLEMSRVYFYPDISYQEIKTIERQFNSNNNEYLINKASDFIFNVISCEQSKSNRILFICGPGSNGLDGIYSACKLKLSEYRVNIFLCNPSIDTSYIKKCSLSEIIISNPTLNQFDCIVDCIFGYGINRILVIHISN